MQRLQAFKYELQPDGQQQCDMRRFAGSCRFVFNRALALQRERCAQGAPKLCYAALCKQLTEWRNAPQTAWLAESPVHPLQQALKGLERAYTNFFAKRAAFPRFRKKSLSVSFRHPPQNTSRTCPACGHVAKENRKAQARFACVACGFEEPADRVGAINVLRARHARLACGDTSSAVGASAQEPTEATTQRLRVFPDRARAARQKMSDLGAKHSHSSGYGEHLQRRAGGFWRDERA